MTQLAIIGHKTRGKEVIELLEMFGYVNYHKYSADCDSLCFYGGENTSTIYYDWVNNCEDMRIFTLEEFLEKYPYKVGDKVNYVKYNDECPSVYTIQKMRWTGVTIEYLLDSSGFSALTKDLQPYKEEETMNKAVFDANAQCCDIMNHLIKKETTEEKIESFEVLESHCANEVKIEFDPSKFEIVKRDNGYYVVKKHPQYPKTYEECCDVLNVDVSRTIEHSEDCPFYRDITCYEYDLLSRLAYLRKLLICRDAYWKIAGEQMGLGKPWKPDWEDQEKATIKYCICISGNVISKDKFYLTNFILSFPTEEMRDAFYENFNVLIEICKELL